MDDLRLDKGYEPADVEQKWYDFWVDNRLFNAEEEGGAGSFSIVIPPPNVTGVLHMGHALNNTLQDILCRYRRLKGDNVLWMPGTDHAGIATQNVVEKQLASEGKTRDEVGREKFIETVWKWKETSGSAIINQLKRLGASCDWERERFTMDEGLSRAVRKVFVELYKQGLIYRGNYITNWCPRCNTALADLEVEYEEREGHLYHIRYPFADGSGYFVVATTRPETLFGDTAVAVNPDDERYQSVTAKTVSLPLTRREIPIIKDSYVDMEFGTGALKVTPAHDPNDFEIGGRHNLDRIKVISDTGLMLEGAGRFEGMSREECRKAAVEALKEEGLLEKIEQHDHSVGSCYRCKTAIEPNLSLQWFVRTKPLADRAIEAVRDGRTRIIPENWTKTYFEWLENIRDWCISRQIWWGHRIPVWTCSDCGEEIVEFEDPTVCPKCSGTNLTQDTDVLDTWFSSALWPFSTMGWPEETKLLKSFYPTSTLITGFDILFFWVARMMMMGLHFMDDVPFHDVYIHALVRDEQGQKMSKSKGNVIDPLTVIEKYGTDSFRFTLAAFAAQGRDVKMSLPRVEGYRHFINKLWNAARFSFMHIDSAVETFDKDKISLADRWILSRLAVVTEQVEKTLDDYKFNETASVVYNFVWHEFCDWYLEAAKTDLYGKNGDERMNATKGVLWRILKDTLILLHPVIPFVTEEIWSKLPGVDGSIMKAEFPDKSQQLAGICQDSAVEAEMELVIETISAIRNIRGEMNIAPSKQLRVVFQSDEEKTSASVEGNSGLITNLARLESLSTRKDAQRPKSAATAVVGDGIIHVDLGGIIDFEKEVARLEKAIAKLNKEVEGLSKKLSNEGFVSKAPGEVIDKVKGQMAESREKLDKYLHNLERIKGAMA